MTRLPTQILDGIPCQCITLETFASRLGQGMPVAATAENMIEIRGASWRANPLSGKEILVDVSLAVPRGTTLVLLGRSGSGKTTLLKLINGMLQPSGGQVRVGGRATRE